MWFLNIDKIAQKIIDKCLPCQANSKANTPEPLQASTLPTRPWNVVHINFCGPFPTGELILVVIDTYSKFLEVEIIQSTSARAAIPKLDRIFSTNGVPRIIKSDNGPPFDSKNLSIFMNENGIKHERVAP